MSSHDHSETTCGCTTCRRGGACPCGQSQPISLLAPYLASWRSALPSSISAAELGAFVRRVEPRLAIIFKERPPHHPEELHAVLASIVVSDAAAQGLRGWLLGEELAGRTYAPSQLPWITTFRDEILRVGALDRTDLQRFPFSRMGGQSEAERILGGAEALELLLRRLNSAFDARRRFLRRPLVTPDEPLANLDPALHLPVYDLLVQERAKEGLGDDPLLLAETTVDLVDLILEAMSRANFRWSGGPRKDTYHESTLRSRLFVRLDTDDIVSLERCERLADRLIAFARTLKVPR